MSYKINICKKFDVQKFSDSMVHVLYIKGFISDLLIKVAVTGVIWCAFISPL